jgi:hypothetical protein
LHVHLAEELSPPRRTRITLEAGVRNRQLFFTLHRKYCSKKASAFSTYPLLARRANVRRAVLGEVLALPHGGVLLNPTIFESNGTITELRAPIVLAGGAPPLIGAFDAPMRVALGPHNAPLSLAVAAA